jgi:hypothetical protein
MASVTIVSKFTASFSWRVTSLLAWPGRRPSVGEGLASAVRGVAGPGSGAWVGPVSIRRLAGPAARADGELQPQAAAELFDPGWLAEGEAVLGTAAEGRHPLTSLRLVTKMECRHCPVGAILGLDS